MSVLISTPAKQAVPPLHNGDHLSRDEFHRRYLAMPDLKKAELINGVVFMPSPVRDDVHGESHGIVVTWVGTYALQTPGVRFAVESTVRLKGDNEAQPDVHLRIESSRGGRATLDADGYIKGGARTGV